MALLPTTPSRGTSVTPVLVAKPREPISKRLHPGAHKEEILRAPTPGTFKSAACPQAHLRRLAHHGHELAQKKVEQLDLQDTLLFPDTIEAPRQQQQILELDELCARLCTTKARRCGFGWPCVERSTKKKWWLSSQEESAVARLVGAYGKRSPNPTKERLVTYSDFWEAYPRG